MDHLPLPSLQIYTIFSSLGLFYAFAYSMTTADGFFFSLWWDDWCAIALVNFLCCMYFQFMSFIHVLVFNTLLISEKKHMQDKFWNFVFYQFIFIFGVMNVQNVREILLWCGWASLVGCFFVTSHLCKDRFLYLSFSPTTPSSSHAKVITLLSGILISCAGLFMVSAIVGWQFGFNHFAFLFSEVYILFTVTLLTLIRYMIYLWDMYHEGLWENRNNYTYYTEFILEISSLCVQFMHHLHMLIWANMFLSVASLILLMKLRFLYQEIQRKLKRHNNYILVKTTLEKSFDLVKLDESTGSEQICAICWEKMKSARKLSCGHLFHFGCLRSWLEQDPVCPTCRQSLSVLLQQESINKQASLAQKRRNWLLFFNGASIASWLPTFSLEVYDDPPSDSQNSNYQHDLLRGAREIHSMFPDIPFNAITLDLNNTQSVTQTVNNILSGDLSFQRETFGNGPAQSSAIIPYTETDPMQSNNASDSNDNNNVKDMDIPQPGITHQQTYSTLSFQDRKKKIIENARKKYLLKHPNLSTYHKE